IDSTDVPCIIAGGLDEHNVTEAIHITNPYGVDSFSRTNYEGRAADMERCKDPDKVKAFIEAVRNA
ncbi:MAG TPA: N-(5'-phosphoribosyl)anthranilate isomerase, partial [Clostridiales bacterium]|nr:N-(5'-phosphoribosyl)anthranilate isomerase [Clostridiales bacterium]